MKAAFPLVLLMLVAFGCSNGVDKARQETVEFIETIDWPEGYEVAGTGIQDPSNALSQGRSGNANTSFVHTSQPEAELLADFHKSLTDAGFLLRDTFPHECEPGSVQVSYWHSEHKVGAATLRFSKSEETGNAALVVQMGWGTRSQTGPELAVGVLPTCQ